MFRRIVGLWKFLRKSREEKKAELSRDSLDVFEALDAIDSSEKQALFPYVKDLYNDLMEIEVLRFKVNLIAKPLLYLFLFIVWVFVGGYILVIFDSLLQFFFSVHLFSATDSTNINNIESFLVAHHYAYLGVVLALVLTLLYLGGFLLWLYVSGIITVYLVLPPSILVYIRFFDRLRNKRYPVASLVDNLIWLLHYAERHQIKEQEKSDSRMNHLIEYKKRQVLLLEGAARCLERYVPRQLRGRDIVTDYWLQETFQLAAAALREKKTWVLTPKKDTYKYFIGSIAHALKYAIEDNWDSLERVEMEELIKRQKLARSQMWRFRLVALLKAAFVAILPVIGFILLQLTPLAIAGATRTYVIVGLFIWVGLSALTLLDSDLEKKLGMMNSIKSLFSFSGQNNPQR